MLAHQKLVASDGYEVVLFPFEYMYMTQDEGGDFSHQDTYNIDFQGWGADGRIYNCPFYAPCTLKCVAIWDPDSNNRVYESVNPVHLANGKLDYLTITFAHDDTPIHNVGDVVEQGELLGHTGTTGYVTGDHTHSCCGMGKYEGFTLRSGTSNYDLTNRIHYWDATYVNDTIIVQGYNHNWITYDGDITPIKTRKSKFKWVLYARKLRNKSQIFKMSIIN